MKYGPDIAGFLGLVSLCGGVALISVPAALIVAGLLLIALAVAGARAPRGKG